MRNAGLEGSVVVEHLSREKRTNWGFDVMSEEYVDLVAAGIIDPAKVTRTRAGERRQRGGHDPDHRGAGHGAAREEGSAPRHAGWRPDMYD